MLNARSQTPSRPRPPAKLRRETQALSRSLSIATQVEAIEKEGLDARRRTRKESGGGSASPGVGSGSPPPAYEVQLESGDSEDGLVVVGMRRAGSLGSGFGGEEREATLLGSPIPTTFKLLGAEGVGGVGGGGGGGAGVLEEWMNERSKEELKGLLVKAGEVIKERENELGLTSKVVKGLYESNVALKTSLARIPHQGATDTSTTTSPDRVIPHNTDADSPNQPRRLFPTSSSTTSLALSSPPLSPSPSAPPPLYRTHRRGTASISPTELSLLADQNAELMLKLEALEAESTSADHAGRRELRRLEKEIATLRAALEKTQAKSEELEAKTRGLDKGIDRKVEEAWRKRSGREGRARGAVTVGGARRFEQEEEEVVVDEMGVVRDFAPRGSAFGGPSKGYPLSRSLGHSAIDVFGGGQHEDEEVPPPPAPPAEPAPKPELEIVAQLLQKVKELEETNARILQQQAETANQLQAVQRDTEQITKVYECFAEPGDLGDSDDEPLILSGHSLAGPVDFGEITGMPMSTPTSRLVGARRRVDSSTSMRRGKLRRSVHGDASNATTPHRTPDLTSLPPVPPFSHSNAWNHEMVRQPHPLHRSSYSLASPNGLPASLDAHFSSDEGYGELSPINTRLTLDSELGSSGLGWDDVQGLRHQQSFAGWHLRSQSLSNLSQLSVPSSPTPSSSSGGQLASAPLPSSMGGGGAVGETTPVAFEFPKAGQRPRTPPSPEVERTMPGTLPMASSSSSGEPVLPISTSNVFPAQPALHVFPPTPSKRNRLGRSQSRPRTPHTPNKASASSSNSNDNDQSHLAALHSMSGPKSPSPRHEFISQRINARKARWEDGRFGSMSSTTSVWGSPKSSVSGLPGGGSGGLYIANGMFMTHEAVGQRQVFVPPPARVRSGFAGLGVAEDGNEEDDEGGEEDDDDEESDEDEGLAGPRVRVPAPAMRISTIVNTLVDRFEGVAVVVTSEDDSSHDELEEEAVGNSSMEREEHSEYEDAATDFVVSEVYEDTGDELDRDDDEEEDEDQTMVNKTPVFSEENALQLHQYDGMEKMVLLKQHKARSASASPSSGSTPKLFLAKSSSVASSSPNGHHSQLKPRKRSQTVTQASSSSSAVEDGKKKQGAGWGRVLLELWLWLQFAVIIFVFLCAMAKRGPKAVLADAERGVRGRKQSVHLRR